MVTKEELIRQRDGWRKTGNLYIVDSIQKEIDDLEKNPEPVRKQVEKPVEKKIEPVKKPVAQLKSVKSKKK